MMRQHSVFRTNGFRLLVVCSTLTWGIAEFLALQRSRFQAWRNRT